LIEGPAQLNSNQLVLLGQRNATERYGERVRVKKEEWQSEKEVKIMMIEERIRRR
jgi:hypothetical protein